MLEDKLERIDLFRFLSELGKPGAFDATKGNVARVWRVRPGIQISPGQVVFALMVIIVLINSIRRGGGGTGFTGGRAVNMGEACRQARGKHHSWDATLGVSGVSAPLPLPGDRLRCNTRRHGVTRTVGVGWCCAGRREGRWLR